MQGLSDGYFIIPYTVGNYIAQAKLEKVDTSHPEFRNAETQVNCLTRRFLEIKGKRTVDSFHRELGKLVWDYCGMSRTAEGLEFAIGKIRELRDEYWQNLNVVGSADELNQSLEKAGRVADFFELAELMCLDAPEPQRILWRATFQARNIRPPRERLSATTTSTLRWPPGSMPAPGRDPVLHKEPLAFEYVHPSQRSYK